MICIPVTERTQCAALRSAAAAAQAADAVELRMDIIEDGDLPRLIDAARRAAPRVRIVVTCRRKDERAVPDGVQPSREMTKKAKMALLEQAIALEADFVDIELAEGVRAIGRLQSLIRRRQGKTQVIVSWHDTAKTPSLAKLREIFAACVRTGADVVKIVPTARRADDNLKVLALIRHARWRGVRIIAMCMGEAGQQSRVLAPLRGSFLAFAVLPSGRKSAPGQLSVSTMRGLERLLQDGLSGIRPRFSPGGPAFVLLGNPVAHSLSPLMHNEALAAMGIDGHYSAFCVTDPAAAVAGIRGLNIRGASVTLPFKTAVAGCLDGLSADAAALGAVNTIVNERGRLIGHNTDWVGLLQALREGTDIAGQTFVILGAGGTARAAVYGIKKEGGRPVIVNRTPEKGRLLAAAFDCPCYPPEALGKIRARALINTTPVGMTPRIHESPVPAKTLAHFPVVMDVIYNPLATRLLKDAKAQGCRIVSGLEMFVRQGAAQLKLWTGREAPLALMRAVVRERLETLDNG